MQLKLYQIPLIYIPLIISDTSVITRIVSNGRVLCFFLHWLPVKASATCVMSQLEHNNAALTEYMEILAVVIVLNRKVTGKCTIVDTRSGMFCSIRINVRLKTNVYTFHASS